MAAKQPLEILTPTWGEYIELPEGDNQTFRKGMLVGLTNGRVTGITGNPASGSVLGVATMDARNTVNPGNTIVFVPSANCLFLANVAAAQTTAVTDVGAAYGLTVEANNVHVNKADTTNTRVRIVKLDPRDPVGDVNGRVWFRFLPGTLLFGA